MDNDILIPQKPIFYRWFVDDIINRRKKNITDELVDTQLVNLNGKIETKVYRKPNKLPVPLSPSIPKRYKKNGINGGFHRAKRIAKTVLNKLSDTFYRLTIYGFISRRSFF